MESIHNNNFTVYHAGEYREYAQNIAGKLPAMAQSINHTWGIDTSGGCRVYILDSMFSMILHPRRLPGKLLMLITLPVWYSRAVKAWNISAGWTLNNSKERMFGIKTAGEMLKAAERNNIKIYARAFDDIGKRAEYTACHEMTHAFTSHFRLPFWLSEGIAQYAADRYAGEPTIREETLAALAGEPDGAMEAFLSGYWIVRRIEEKNSGAIAGIIKKGADYNAGIAEVLGVPEAGYKEYIRALRQEK